MGSGEVRVISVGGSEGCLVGGSGEGSEDGSVWGLEGGSVWGSEGEGVEVFGIDVGGLDNAMTWS